MVFRHPIFNSNFEQKMIAKYFVKIFLVKKATYKCFSYLHTSVIVFGNPFLKLLKGYQINKYFVGMW